MVRPEPPSPERRLSVIWSQDEMWKRTAIERWFARHRRRLAIGVLAVTLSGAVVIAAGVLLAEGLLHPPRRTLTAADAARARAAAARAESRLSDETLRAGDGVALEAWWFVPRGRSRGTVIVLHGQSDNRAAMLGLAELLLSHEYRVLAPDARAHGSSGGKLATYGILERDDLRAWAHWAERRYPDECVFGAGASMGASILVQALPDVPFCAAVSDSAFADLLKLARARLGVRLHLPPILHGVVAGPVVRVASWYARLWHAVSLATARPAESMARGRVPALVVHGIDDQIIPAADARTLAAANPRFVTLWLVPGGRHTGSWAAAPREYPERVLTFLAEHQ